MPAITSTDLNNAKLDVDHIAAIATSTNTSATDRLGGTKLTVKGAIDTIKSVNSRGVWASTTAYAVKDLVLNGSTWYICVVAHTSSALFATDEATKWRVYQGALLSELNTAFATAMAYTDSLRSDLSAASGGEEVGFLSDISGSVLTTVDAELKLLGVRRVKNILWASEFACWPMGHAQQVSTAQRVQVPTGITHSRLNRVSGTTVSHVDGTYSQDAMRIQRNSGVTTTDSHNYVITLSREETKLLNGKVCTLQVNGKKSSGYSGGDILCKVQCSKEPEQPILSDSGAYTNGSEDIATAYYSFGTSTRPENNPFLLTFTVPNDAVQVSLFVSISWVGTAGTADFVEFEGVSLHVGAGRGLVVKDSFTELMMKSRTRYQTSYPYGAPRGIVTEQGSVSSIAVSTEVNWAWAAYIKFFPEMVLSPQFLFQSPTSGTESRWLDKTSGTNINGLAYNLSESGVTITNNAIPTVGRRYLCQWTAQVIL